jgi:hypothetical protein
VSFLIPYAHVGCNHQQLVAAESGNFPYPAVTAELQHQVEQWRLNLPPGIQFPDYEPEAPHGTPLFPIAQPLPIDQRGPVAPATAVAEAMLRGRFKIAKFHIGRPYLYKALRTPRFLTDDDLEQVKSGLKNAMDWPFVKGIFAQMTNCIPIKFAFCSQ